MNGRSCSYDTASGASLLAFLRHDLGLLGAKPGCGEGACGACTVLLDGEPVRSCVLPAEIARGRAVTTIEGLSSGGRLHPVAQAFLESGAVQCGYCTPGMVLAVSALLARNPDPSDTEIVTALDGNICRCCGYPAIIRAVRLAAGPPTPGQASPVISAEAPALPYLLDTPDASRRVELPWGSVPRAQRDLFSVLPDGLVVVAERADPEWAEATCIEAWLHLGADGSVTGFTGKVDVGQGNRGALGALIAEELRLPVEAIRLVMGDTDICPFDAGTFGSRSLPDSAPLLARAAATARETLIAMAAERWQVEATALGIADGSVHGSGEQSPTYAELLTGLRRVAVSPPAERLTPRSEWRVAGRTFAHAHRVGFVTGTSRFPSDLVRPGMVAGAVLHPPTFGAGLARVGPSTGGTGREVHIVHEGSFLGAIAPTPRAAREDLASLECTWTGPTQPTEPELEDYLRTHPAEASGWDGAFAETDGDVELALAQAPVRVEATYSSSYIAHAPLETRAALAEWHDGDLTVWTGTQRPFAVRERLAAELGIDETRIRVVAPTAGGGFGGKHSGDVAVEAARLARAAGRTVKVHWTRGEEFQHAYARPAAVIDIRSGANDNGDLLAWDLLNVNAGSAGIASPYRSGASRIRFQPAESPLPQGSYRALAATANTFARESHLDELAARLGIDPVEFRMRHLLDERLKAVLATTAERADWAAHSTEGGRALGIACGLEKDARVATCAEIELQASGAVKLTRIVTAVDCGAVVDPDNLVAQIEGATVMGIGGALFEALDFADGKILNASFADYRVPRFSDVPPIDVVLVDRRDIAPAGAGETPLIAVAPAIANAVSAATGKHLRSLPLQLT